MQFIRHVAKGWVGASMLLLALTGSHLRAEESPDATLLIKNLSSETPGERNAAAAALEKMGEGARKTLETALAAKPDTQTRRGIERLLEKLPPRNALYVKVLLSGDAPDDSSTPVEPWILKEVKGNDGAPLHAVSDWCLLTENTSTRLMSEIRCGVPCNGTLKRVDGTIKVSFTIHGPFRIPVFGDTINDEMGARSVAYIGSEKFPHAYVALMVGPEPRHPANYQKIAKADQAEPFKP